MKRTATILPAILFATAVTGALADDVIANPVADDSNSTTLTTSISSGYRGISTSHTSQAASDPNCITVVHQGPTEVDSNGTVIGGSAYAETQCGFNRFMP